MGMYRNSICMYWVMKTNTFVAKQEQEAFAVDERSLNIVKWVCKGLQIVNNLSLLHGAQHIIDRQSASDKLYL
jgi:hypothetical protein